MPGGRPSLYSEEVAKRICERLANGEPLAKICRDEDMPDYSTARRWEDSNEEFRALSLRAKSDGTHFMADDSIRIADDDSIDPQRAKLMVDTRLRLIGMWNRKDYGPKSTTVHEDPQGNNPFASLMEAVQGAGRPKPGSSD